MREIIKKGTPLIFSKSYILFNPLLTCINWGPSRWTLKNQSAIGGCGSVWLYCWFSHWNLFILQTSTEARLAPGSKLFRDWCTVHLYGSKTGPSKVCVPIYQSFNLKKFNIFGVSPQILSCEWSTMIYFVLVTHPMSDCNTCHFHPILAKYQMYAGTSVIA